MTDQEMICINSNQYLATDQLVEDAIAESIAHGATVYVEATTRARPAIEASLFEACEVRDEDEGVNEFRGTDHDAKRCVRVRDLV